MNFFTEMKSLASDVSNSQRLKSKFIASIFSEDAFYAIEVPPSATRWRRIEHGPLARPDYSNLTKQFIR
jgi:hypothetical protein